VLLGISEWSLDLSLHHIVNDFFMALFFLVVGLELKREILSGELSEFKRAIIPIAAAAGGMIVPASIYLAFNIGTGGSVGWGVPMATDIAFTLGVLALLGSRVPTSMKVFAAALAVIDDLGAILVLAIGYNHGISWAALAAAGGLMAVLMGFNAARVYRLWPYLIVGTLLWAAVYSSGLHATIAGVLVAVTIPERERPSIIPMLAGITSSAPQFMHHLQTSNVSEDAGWHYFARRIREIDLRLRSPASRLEHALQPWSQYFILPVFALANAGIELSINNVRPTDHVVIGIFLALVVGKPVGIFAGAWLIDRLGLGRKPDDATWPQVLGVGMLCGIGFTMSIFIANEAFGGTEELAAAKLAVIAASLVAGLVGFIFLFGTSKDDGKTI
jgi:NhaA family Na+:H+ antiporter